MKSGRSKDTEFLVYGFHAILEAISAGKEFERIMIQKQVDSEHVKQLIDSAKIHQIPVSRVPREKLNRLVNKNHQGVVGLIARISYASLDHVISAAYQKGINPLILILDRITDVRNFGAICRTAVATGADAVVIPAIGSAQINADAMKTSAGALNHLPVCREADLYKTVLFLQDNGLMVIGCSEQGTQSIHETELTRPLAIVLGNEETGLSSPLKKKVDLNVNIPMLGKVSSLNVSVAAGVVLYEVIRQRNLK